MPHLDAAYNLARWLMRNEDDAQDMVQEAYLRALRFFGGFHGTDARAWLLTIVRNTCYTWLKRSRSLELSGDFEEAVLTKESDEPNPEASHFLKVQSQVGSLRGYCPNEVSRYFECLLGFWPFICYCLYYFIDSISKRSSLREIVSLSDLS